MDVLKYFFFPFLFVSFLTNYSFCQESEDFNFDGVYYALDDEGFIPVYMNLCNGHQVSIFDNSPLFSSSSATECLPPSPNVHEGEYQNVDDTISISGSFLKVQFVVIDTMNLKVIQSNQDWLIVGQCFNRRSAFYQLEYCSDRANSEFNSKWLIERYQKNGISDPSKFFKYITKGPGEIFYENDSKIEVVPASIYYCD